MARLAPTTLTGKYSARTLVLASIGMLAAASLTGCGFGKADVSTAAIVSPALNGKTFGGPNPIIGATVTLYTTGNSSGLSTGYGVATNRQQTTTNGNGSFTFAGGYTCPAGQFAYVVSAGGNTGASGSATGAQATANWQGITSVALVGGGTSYSATPTVTINDPTGTGATATATVSSGVITKLNLGLQGNGYTSPTITITDGTGSGATGSATAGAAGTITGVAVTTPGSGYLSATVTITPTDGHGSGATATANFSGPGNTTGGITSITVNNTGSGYTATPTVSISAPTSNNPANTNAVLVAALGRCEDLYANTSGGAYTGSGIDISEISTVAVAYALGHFSTVSGSGASTVVSIGSSATNNVAPIGSALSTGCAANGGSCATTAAAGLAHAFLNAATLVNVFQNPVSNNGANATVTPAYSTYLTGYGAAAPVVPQQLINTIGNIFVACVNSAGGTAGDGSACGNIFSATTLPAAIVPTYTVATPTNTFTALVNLAYNPTLSGSTSAVSNFFNIASGFTSVYSPALTGIGLSSSNTLLNDYSIAIQYPATGIASGLGYTPTTANTACATTPCQGLAFPTSMALDINDNLYIANQTAAAGTSVNLLLLSSTGKLLSETALGPTLKQGLGLSVDALGNGYFVNGSSSAVSVMGYFTVNGGTTLNQFSALAAGSIKSYATAVDRANNVWVAGPAAGANSVFVSGAGGASFAAKSNVTFTAAGSPPDPVAIAIDPNQNVWVAGAAGLGIIQNTGTLLLPTYTNATAIAPTSITGTTMSGITFAGSSPYIGYVGNYTTNPGVQPFTPTFNNAGAGPGVASAGGGTLVTGGVLTGTDIVEADGAGVIWNASANTHSLSPLFNPTNPSTDVSYKIIPCLGTSGGSSTTCIDGLTSSLKADLVNIDSSGSIWVGAQAGALLQFIGAATPTWPLLSLGVTGQP